MTLRAETISFITFIFIGMLFSAIFDFFRAVRKVRKTSIISIYVQDIIYFVIIGIIMLTIIINFMSEGIRGYLIFGIILGIIMYIGVFGNIVRNIFINILRLSGGILEFLMLPLNIYSELFDSQINILKKIVVKYCKKISYMVNLNHIIVKFKTKEDLKK